MKLSPQPVTMYEVAYAKKNALPDSRMPKNGERVLSGNDVPSEITIREMLSGVKDADGNSYFQMSGNAIVAFGGEEVARDHPRLRGKDMLITQNLGKTTGSPPLARERLFDFYGDYHMGRITPACAGKTLPYRREHYSIKDHPRLRGKDWIAEAEKRCVIGSPPLARERRGDERRAETRKQDHPRLRGKDLLIPPCRWPVLGSPPLARERPSVL